MRQKIRILAFLSIALGTIFLASCAQGQGQEGGGQVVFSIDAKTARSILKSARADLSFDAANGSDRSLKLDISLSGSYSQTKTVDITYQGAQVVFGGLSSGGQCKVHGEVYEQSQNPADKKILYDGDSDPFTVRDGTTRVNLPLTRVYYVEFYENGGTWTGERPTGVHYKKGTPFDLPKAGDIQKAGLLFAGWWTSPDGGATLDQKFKWTQTTTGDLSLYAKWVENGIGGITVTIYSETSDLALAAESFDDPASGPGVRFTATPPSGKTCTYTWYVDGLSDSDPGSENNVFEFIKEGKAKGAYDIKVVAQETGGSTMWSAFAQAKVE